MSAVAARRAWLTPEGSILRIDGTFDLVQQPTFHLVARVGPISALPLLVAPGLRLADQEARLNFLPPGFFVTDVRMADVRGQVVATAELEIKQYFGDTSLVRWGVLEARTGCVEISIADASHDQIVALLAELAIDESMGGIRLSNSIDNSQSAIAAYITVEGVGILIIQPAIPEVLRRYPSSGGQPVDSGTLYRISGESKSVVLVGSSAVTTLSPSRLSDIDPTPTLADAVVSWRPEE